MHLSAMETCVYQRWSVSFNGNEDVYISKQICVYQRWSVSFNGNEDVYISVGVFRLTVMKMSISAKNMRISAVECFV